MTLGGLPYYTNESYFFMIVSHKHKEALQQLITDYWSIWVRSSHEELPGWFYLVLDFMEVKCLLRFSVVSGMWEEM